MLEDGLLKRDEKYAKLNLAVLVIADFTETEKKHPFDHHSHSKYSTCMVE